MQSNSPRAWPFLRCSARLLLILALLLPGPASADVLSLRIAGANSLRQALTLIGQGKLTESDRYLREFLVAELSQLDRRTALPVISARIDPAQSRQIESVARKLLADPSAEAEAHTVLGVVAILRRDHKSAETSFASAIARKPGYVTPRLYLAMTHRLSGRSEAALKVYQDLIKAHPGVPGGHVGLAEAHYSSGNRAAAIQVLTEWKQRNRANPEPANVLGLLYAAEQRYPQALAEFEASLAASPNYPPALSNRGDLLLLSGDQRAAIASYQQALQADKYFVPAYLRLGTVHVQAGQLNEALKVFERAVAVPVPVAVFYNNAAWLMIRLKGDIDRALDLAEQAVQLEPENADARGTLGWAALEKGQLPRAILELRRAKELAGPRPESSLNLGRAYVRSKMKDEALSELNELTKLFPASPEAATARELIAELSR